MLRQDADRLVSQAWCEAFVPIKEEEVPRQTSISSLVGLSPLDITPIVWEYPSKGICMLDILVGSALVWQQCFKQVFQFGNTFMWREMRSRGGFHRTILHY